MKDIFSVDFHGAIRKVVKRELKEKFGIKAGKEKLKSSDSKECQSSYFGVTLEDVPSKSIKDDQYYCVPNFLVDALEYLNDHVKVEGLFRKSGSVGRQKVLREILEKEGTCCSCEFVQPHDIAALVKQFFRELPDPLLTRKLASAFLKCVSLTNPNDCISATALCCLLLPDEHLRVLKYFVDFIAEMANHSLESKMTLSNLAIIFAPNLTSVIGKDKNGEKSMKECTQIVDLIFKNSHLIGMVPDALFNKASTMNQEEGFCSSSCDELDAPDEQPASRGRSLQRSEKKRDRSKSITGFLRRNFKTNEKSSGNTKHVRSRTCEKPTIRENLQVPKRTTSIKEFGDPIWKNQERPIKRRNNSKTNMSPVRKSPRLGGREQQVTPIISLPKLKTLPNQVATTPRRMLQPIHNQDHLSGRLKAMKPAALPSKFEIPAANKSKPREDEPRLKPRISRSKSSAAHVQQSSNSPTTVKSHGNKTSHEHTNDEPTTTDQQQPMPQPKLSRATQKPHVRKTRRTSSLDRRRARYASASHRIRRQLPKVPNQKDLDESNVSLSCSDISTSRGESGNIAFLTSHHVAPRASLDTSIFEKKPKAAKRRLPKASSTTTCKSPLTKKENKSPITPTGRNIKRSNTSVRKPATPYSVTPQIGTRRSTQVINFVTERQPLVL